MDNVHSNMIDDSLKLNVAVLEDIRDELHSINLKLHWISQSVCVNDGMGDGCDHISESLKRIADSLERR